MFPRRDDTISSCRLSIWLWKSYIENNNCLFKRLKFYNHILDGILKFPHLYVSFNLFVRHIHNLDIFSFVSVYKSIVHILWSIAGLPILRRSTYNKSNQVGFSMIIDDIIVSSSVKVFNMSIILPNSSMFLSFSFKILI